MLKSDYINSIYTFTASKVESTYIYSHICLFCLYERPYLRDYKSWSFQILGEHSYILQTQ